MVENLVLGSTAPCLDEGHCKTIENWISLAKDGGESYIYFEFKSGIDFETEGGDEGEGNHPILGSKHMDEFEEAH